MDFKNQVIKSEIIVIEVNDNCSYFDQKFVQSLRYTAGDIPGYNNSVNQIRKSLKSEAEINCHQSVTKLRKHVLEIRKRAITLFSEWRGRITESKKLTSSRLLDEHNGAQEKYDQFKDSYASLMASLRIALLARKEISNFLKMHNDKIFQSEEEFTKNKERSIRMFETETVRALQDIIIMNQMINKVLEDHNLIKNLAIRSHTIIS
ncbi:MAG TPA: hypothetical protein PKA63_08450 [Oligoflexia bacterium]|nr:hypothetical protein [Oligoflexia bacterium]HMP48680.1 hypothetical protein [Oligoflexia bacterium]